MCACKALIYYSMALSSLYQHMVWWINEKKEGKYELTSDCQGKA